MKRDLSILLALVMVFALCACGSSAPAASQPAAEPAADQQLRLQQNQFPQRNLQQNFPTHLLAFNLWKK